MSGGIPLIHDTPATWANLRGLFEDSVRDYNEKIDTLVAIVGDPDDGEPVDNPKMDKLFGESSFSKRGIRDDVDNALHNLIISWRESRDAIIADGLGELDRCGK